MKHEVRTFNAAGKMMYTEAFATAEKAYKEYRAIIETVSKHFPKGYTMTVARYNDGTLMTLETVTAK